MKKIDMVGLGLETKYLPFLIKNEEESIVKVSGYNNGFINLDFLDGLKGVLVIESENEELKSGLQNKGYFVVNSETGEMVSYNYEETKVKKTTETSRSGSMNKKLEF